MPRPTWLVKHILEVVEKLVARRALHGPARRELFAERENFFDDDRRVRRRGGAQPIEICLRVEQAVDVIDAQPIDDTVAHQMQHERVRLVEHRWVFHAKRYEIAHVEEAAVVDLR